MQLKLDLPELPPEAEAMRSQVRAFIAEERKTGRLKRPDKVGMGVSAEMSQRLGAAGFIGLTWPKAYGGQARSALERYVVTEELLAAAVPVGAHWVADRQSGPVILRFGSDAQKETYLPRIARGECYFCIGMSEPNSGSDLASLRSTGTKIEGGWRLNGHKLWTTNAHRCHYMIILVRTSKSEEARHAGFSQFIVDLKAPGVTIRPVINMAGEHDFNEVVLDDVEVPGDALIGKEGNGWNQVSAELAYERSGPERWLSSFRLLNELADVLGTEASDTAKLEIGRLVSHFLTLRQLSMSVASALQAGRTPSNEAAIVKDLGTRFEQELVKTVRNIALADGLLAAPKAERLAALVAHGQLYAPAFTIRGGTAEILRGIIARGLGLR